MKKGKRFLALLLSFAMIVTLLPSQVALAAGDGDTGETAGTGDSTQDDGLKAGDYYIINAKTGMLLNGGNNYGSQASAFTYGQLMTLEVENSEEDTYAINSHIQETSPKTYLGANGFLDGEKASMEIKPSGDGNYTIKSSENKYLTAPSDDSTVVTFETTDTEYSKWRILTREKYIMEAAVKVEKDSSSPVDVTSLILDSHTGRYNQYYSKWSGKFAATLEGNKNKYPDSQTWGKYTCVEKYKAAFDTYQIIENVPNGEYELSVQGFHRVEDSNNPAAPVYYINDAEGALKTAQSEGKTEKVEGLWTADKGGVYVPNQMSEAAKCFETGAYSNEFISVKVTDHKIKVGLKATDNKSWVLWDNFTLRLKSLLPADEDAGYAIEKINAIGNVEYTNECKTKIDTARTYYDLLTPTQKNSVSAEQLKILTDAEQKYEDEMLKATISPIILNGNYSFNRVHNNLDMAGSILEDSVEFTVTSSDTNVIANDGTIAAAVQTGSTATLTATLKKAGEETVWKTFEFPVTIIKNAALTDDSITYDFDDETLQGAMPIIKGYSDYAGDVKYADGMNYKEGNKALSLDGNYGIELPLYNLDSEDSGSWSVSLWYYLAENAGGNQQLLFVGNGNSETENWIGVAGNDGNDGNWKVWHNNNKATDSGHKTMSRIEQNAGSWNMLTLTCEKADDKYKMTTYANGKAIAYTDNYTSPTYNVLNGENQTVRIGVNYWDTPVTGLVDDVKVYTKTLTAAEITSEYETQKKAEFFNKTEDERKALIQEEISKIIPKNRKIASGIQMPTEYAYDGVKVADLAWASDNQNVTTSDGKIVSSDGAPQKAKLSEAVTYVDSKGTAALEYNILLTVEEKAEAVKQGYATSKDGSAGVTSSDAAIDINIGTSEDKESAEIAVGNNGTAPRTEDSLSGTDYDVVGQNRIGYLVFKLPDGMADMSGKELAQATLKIYVKSVNNNLTNKNTNARKNKMKMGLYLVGETDPEKIVHTSESSFAAIAMTGAEDENCYDANHVVWSNEWLGDEQTTTDNKTAQGKVLTFDVKNLFKYLTEDQKHIAFRLQVPMAQAVVQSFGTGANAEQVPELTIGYQVKLSSQEKAEEDAEELSVPQVLTEDDALTLPGTIGFYESGVEWTSQNSAVTLTKEENGGYKVAVTRPAATDATGTLTAKVSNGTGTDKAEITKTFTVTVESMAKYRQTLLADFSFDDDATGLAGAGAKAEKKGNKVEFVNDDDHGKVLSLSDSSYLSVVNASGDDGTPLLKDKEVITVSYWSKPATNADNKSWSFFAGRNNNALAGNEYYLGVIDRNDDIRAERYKGGRGSGSKYDGKQWRAAKDAGWHKIDVVHAAGKSVIYVDGVKKSEMAFEKDWTVKDILGTGDTSVVYIGKANWGSGEFYTGLLDDYRIYGRALTSQEVKEVYDADLEKIAEEKQKAEDQKKVADLKESLEAPTLSAAATISLPTEKDGCTLVWEIVEPKDSDDVKLSTDGKTVTVTRGETAFKVKLKATITCGSASDTSEVYEIPVPALPKDDPATAVKRAELKTAVEEAEAKFEGTKAEDYPEGIWQALKEAIDEANTAVLSGDATAIDTAKTKLETAVAAFKSNDEIANAEDTQKVDNAIAGLPSDLTFSASTDKITLPTVEGCQITWEIIEPKNSEDVKLSSDGKSVEVTRGDNEITVKLQATITSGNVSKKSEEYTVTVPALPQDDEETAAKRDELKTAVTTAEAKLEGTTAEDYPEGVWQSFKDAIDAANTAVATGDKAALEAALQTLKEAESAFKTNAEIAAEAEAAAKAQAVTNLNASIAKQPAKSQADYTPESWKKYQDALAAARAILTNANATAAEINAAKATLDAAFGALAPATNPNLTPTPEQKVTKVTLNKTKLTLGIKDKFTLKATSNPSTAVKSVAWSVDTKGKKYVTLNTKTGKVTGKKKGKATITVTVTSKDGSQIKKTCKVTVKPAPTKKTKISVKKSITVKAKKSTTLKPTVKGNFGCSTFKFTSKNKKVAKVDASGKVTGVKKGKTTITVATYNKKAKTTVKVTVK